MKFKQIILVIPFLVFSAISFSHGHDESSEADFHFTENIGQLDQKVKYHCKLHVGDIYFEKNQFTFDLFSAEDLDRADEIRHNRELRKLYGKEPLILRKHVYSMEFLGANFGSTIVTGKEEGYYKNYIRGNNPDRWYAGASSYEKLSYNNIYPNINMDIYGKGNFLKYDFIVRKGGNPNDIKIAYNNVDQLRLNYGILEIEISTGVVKELKPIAYQMINGKEILVDCFFEIKGNEVTFKFPNGYDTNYELIIDPTWEFSTLTGSSSDNWGFTATYDDNGNFYGGGITDGGNYPTSVGAYDVSFGGNWDAVITKFNPQGTAIIYSTYIGGSGADQPHSLVTDADSNLVVLGVTSSSNFPTTAGAYDQSFNGGSGFTEDGITYSNGTDIFVLKLDNSGAGLIGSTYLGGSSNDGFSLDASLKFNYADHARGEVVLDANNDVYLASSTFSNNFPTTVGAHSQTQFGGYDGVMSKLSANLTNLSWSTYIGGAGGDAAFSVRIDEVNNKAFICGGTTSNNIGTTAGVIGTTYSGATDGFIAKFDNSNGALDALTYIGTTAYDQSYIIELDKYQDVYVVGQTNGNYPVSGGVYSNAGANQFIHKLNNNLTMTDFSTVFGSTNSSTINISLTAFLVDNCDNIYVGGWGGFTNNEGTTNGMPITGNAIQSSTDGSDFYFIVLERDAQNLLYGTYFGSSSSDEHVDGGTSRFDKKGTIYQGVCAGCGGNNFPTSPGAYSSSNGSSNCNFGAIKIGLDFQGVIANATAPPNQVHCGSPYNINFSTGTPVPPNTFWDFGDLFITSDTSTQLNPLYTYADTGTYTVMYVAIDSSSCNISDTVYFSVEVIQNDSLDAQFSFPPYDPCTDSLTIQLDFTGTGADSLYWDMGNGITFINDTSISYTYVTPGLYEVTLEAYDLLCGNTFTLTDTVDFNPVITTVNATAPPNIFLCSSPYNVTFTGNTPAPPNSYWDFGDLFITSDTSTQLNPMYTYADTGSYNVMYVVIDPSTCNIADTAYFNVSIALNDSLDAQFLFPLYDPCTDSLTIQLDFTGSGADSLYWDMGNGTTFINDTSISYTYVTPGLYEVTLEAYDLLCGNTFTLIDTVDFNPVITTVNATAPPNIFLCSSPYNVTFAGNTPAPPNSYWDFGDLFITSDTSTQLNPMYTYADTGSYNVMYVVIDPSTCNIADTAYFNVLIALNDSLDAQFLIPSYDPCTDSLTIQLDFTGSGADSLYWDMGNSTTFINDTSISYTYITPGTYIVTLEAYDLLCSNTFTLTDTVVFTPNATTVNAVLPPNILLCDPPYEVNFTGNTPSSPQSYWEFGDGIGTSTQANPTYVYATTGIYNVMFVAIDPSTCNIADTSYFNVFIQVAPLFSGTIDFEPPPLCGTDSFLVELVYTGIGEDSLLWDMGDGSQFTVDSVFYLYSSAGIYNITMTAYNALCGNDVVSSEVEFAEFLGTESIIPNVFTPNGDGMNDVLQFVGVDGTEEYSIQIFNRWGKKVYEGTDALAHWDGGGHDVGAYFYILKYTDLCSEEEQISKGYVTLLK